MSWIYVDPITSKPKTERTITVTVVGGDWDQYDAVFDAVAKAAHKQSDKSRGHVKDKKPVTTFVLARPFDVTVSGQKVARR